MAEETVQVNPDGSTTFNSGAGDGSTMPPMDDAEAGADETFEGAAAVVGTDPVLYLFLVALVLGLLFFIYRRRSQADEDEFFTNLDGEKVSKLIVQRS
jgi:hypothetical protein